ncbi:MAG: hypothetical protein Q9195_000211 [Heterodermia aff. obscurata]
MSDSDSDSDGDLDGQPPVHPVPTMQGAFEESMAETMEEADDPDPPDRHSIADSVSRRKMLLEQEEYERTVAGRWKQKPGERFHPLWKLVAQISFGMHLLQQGMAKSDEEVIKILQTHVDEIDGFLERTTEDFDLAQGDINERIRYLRLPLEHGDVFDTMLNDRGFRVAIVEGNEKIEHIIDRTAAAMNDALKDVQKGLDATRELAKYLTRIDKNWDDRTEEHDSVYLAMIGNTEGWTRAFLTLQSKGNHLRKGLVQLGSIVAEMQRRAGNASRKNIVPTRPSTARYLVEKTSSNVSPRQPASPRSPMKPLPTAPNAEVRAARHPHTPNGQPQNPRNLGGPAQLAASSHYANMRKNSGSSQLESQSSRNSSRQPSSSTLVAESGLHPSSRQTSNSMQFPSSPQQSRQHLVTGQQQSPVANASPQQFHSSPHADSPRQRVSSGESRQAPLESPHLQHAMSARRVSPVMRIRSERVSSIESSDGALILKEPEPRPTATTRSAVREPSSPITQPVMTEVASLPKGNTPIKIERGYGDKIAKDESQTQDEEENERSGPDLPIQSPPTTKSPPPSRSPVLKRISSHRITIMSTSDYSQTSPRRSLENLITRETSPELHRNSQGVVPSHKAYDSISFLPMHPLLSPLQDPSDPWEIGNQNEPEKDRPQSPPNPPQARIPVPEPIPAQIDTEGAVNTSHPLLLAERHTRFATRTAPDLPKVSKDLPLRHYRSSDAFQRARFGPSDEKEVFVPPKRSSSLIYDHIIGQMGNALDASSPHDTKLSPPPARSSATPSPLNVTQTQSALNPASKLHLKSSKASIVTGPSSATPSTESAVGDSATPPAISRNRSLLSHSKSTPNLLATKANMPLTASEVSESAHRRKMSTNNTPIYLNPVSSAALIDFLASTPPPSPPGRRAQSPTLLKSRGNYGPVGKHSGPFSIFPSNSRPSSAGGKVLAALNTKLDGGPEPVPTPTSAATEKKGWKKVFSGSKKSKGAKAGGGGESPVLLKEPEPEKYRSKKASTRKGGGHKKQGSNNEDGKQNGAAGRGETQDGSGFMGVGKDGVWISRKNFLRT